MSRLDIELKECSVKSKQIYLDCAEISNRSAEYQDNLIPLANSFLERNCLELSRDYFLSQAKIYRELAA